MKHHTITYQPVPRETFTAVDKLICTYNKELNVYLDQLLWWNERINLVSRGVSRETVWQHIRHSLLVTQFEDYQNSSLVVDAGTGGGLPGLPLSIISRDKEFILNDISTKKAMAVKQMAKHLGLKNVVTKGCSIAELRGNAPFLLLSKHAFKIDDLYQMTSGLPWTSIAFYKGTEFKEEIDDINTPLSFTVHDLFTESEDSFYEGKGIIIASRI